MDKFVAYLYIQDYREKIAAEADEAQRHKLLRLLAEEEAKLAAIEARERKERRQYVGLPSISFLVSASIHPLRIRRHGKTRACGRRGLMGPAPVTVERCSRYWLPIQRGTWTHCTGWGVLI